MGCYHQTFRQLPDFITIEDCSIRSSSIETGDSLIVELVVTNTDSAEHRLKADVTTANRDFVDEELFIIPANVQSYVSWSSANTRNLPRGTYDIIIENPHLDPL